MNSTKLQVNTQQNSQQNLLARWNKVQLELIPNLGKELGVMTPTLEKIIYALEWIRIEEFIRKYPNLRWFQVGRPMHDRGMLANAFIAKSIIGCETTVGLIERLKVDSALKRICGFDMYKKLPDESTFSRAFAEFAKTSLLEEVHEAMLSNNLNNRIIGHISRDATAIEAREKPTKYIKAPKEKKFGRGRPKKGEIRKVIKTKLELQQGKSLARLLQEIPNQCDRGTKKNAQGYSVSWNGYKLHMDTADCGVVVSALISSASMHDSLAAIPLSLMSNSRVTNCYDFMDAAYCSEVIRSHSRSLQHVPLIDHNPRGGEKIEFAPHEAQRYKERTQAERTNARLKDEFGARKIRVKGNKKVFTHLMFGILALNADQFIRLIT
jgi:hypothetical protein